MTVTPPSQQKPGFIHTIGAGSAAAVLESVCWGNPMERIRVIQQTNPSWSIQTAISKIYQEAGFKGFYNALSLNMLYLCGKTNLRWGLLEPLQTVSMKISPTYHPLVLAALLSISESLCLVCPIESLKIKRMELGTSFHPLRFIREAGVGRLYDGCNAVILRRFFTWSSFFTAHSMANKRMCSLTGKQSEKEFSIFQKFITASLAGAVSALCAGPADFIKTQMQKTDRIHGGSSLKTIHHIWQKQGLRAFIAGIPIKMFHTAGHLGIQFTAMEELGVFSTK